MDRIFPRTRVLLLALPLVLVLFSTIVFAVPIGYMSWDVTISTSTGEFDIINETGPNSSVFPDTTWPVSTAVPLSSLGLTVHFTDGSTKIFGPSYFTPSLFDPLSFDGGTIPIGGTNPLPIDATLTGIFSTTAITLNDGSSLTILSTFSAAIPTSPGGLSDGDFVIIEATPGGPTAIPEPGTWVLLATGAVGLLLFRCRRLAGILRAFCSTKGHGGLPIALVLLCLLLIPSASWAAVHLNVSATPSEGVAGVTEDNVTGSGFPSGVISPGNVTVSLATTCGGSAAASTAAASVKTIIGSSRRIGFLIPGSLVEGTYFVSISGTTDGGTAFASSDCSKLSVKHTNPTLSACLPTSSLGILAQGDAPTGTVKAYVPNGCWACGTSPGIQVVPLEGGGSPASIPTPSHTVNSCSSNPATGQTVCVANDNNVYLITGTTLNTTLTSGSTGFTSFSGGSCKNCGVAINALTNKAVIAMGLAAAPSGSGIQSLDLNTNTFAAPVPSKHLVSEDISIDPTRNLILSPGEDNSYTLFQIQSDGTVKEFGRPLSGGGGELDTAAEDCSTGIALASDEFTDNIFITDLTQATFTDGPPATWTAPGKFVALPPGGFSAGTSGISVAPGSSHLGIVTGEFGGNVLAVIKLPSTSGSGTPDLVDFAVGTMPTIPGGGTFSFGLDPHTVTAYTSPNDGKAYGVVANSPPPSRLGVIDLACMLALPRDPGTHHVTGSSIGACVRYVATH